MKITALLTLLLFACSSFAANKVYFENLKDGDKVTSPFTVKMGVEGMKIEPAGTQIENTTVGHHHLLIDKGAIKKGDVIPTDAQHLHFGKGQTSTEVTLPPGEHTLTLQFADGAHRSYGPEMSKTVKIKVEATKATK